MMHKLSEDAMARIAESVRIAENRTSAEIKVAVLRYCWVDIREKAQAIFQKHRLHETRLRNACLILVVLANREFLIYGDRGINEKVADDFWLFVRNAMQQEFHSGRLAEGICTGVEIVGDQLAQYFPHDADDENEVSNDVVHDS